MTPSIKAILARFNGNVDAAIRYCAEIAASSPRLALEYSQYITVLRRGHA
jgi:hypothetical protein